MQITTYHDNDLTTRLIGNEFYPIICGNDLHYNVLAIQLVREMARAECLRFADCLRKAVIASEHWLEGRIVGGEICIASSGEKSDFGFAWNPPNETHFWLELPETGEIVDLSLAGVIEAGMNMRDEIGSLLVGRVSGLLVGRCPEWVKYTKHIEVKLR